MCYIHYYYSTEKGADDEQAFDKRIAGLYRELFDDKLIESHKEPMNSFLKLRLRLSVDARLLTKKMTQRKQEGILDTLPLSQMKQSRFIGDTIKIKVLTSILIMCYIHSQNS